jgi:hypothetical protein
MKYWKIKNINANTFVGNEIKRFEVKGYGSVIVTNDKWATGNWATRVGATEVTKAEAQAVLDDYRNTVIANWDTDARSIDIQPEREILP